MVEEKRPFRYAAFIANISFKVLCYFQSLKNTNIVRIILNRF